MINKRDKDGLVIKKGGNYYLDGRRISEQELNEIISHEKETKLISHPSIAPKFDSFVSDLYNLYNNKENLSDEKFDEARKRILKTTRP